MYRYSLLLLLVGSICLEASKPVFSAHPDPYDNTDDDDGQTESSGLMKWMQDNYADFTCEKNCTFLPTSWGATPTFCNNLGETKKNNLCAIGQSYPNCKAFAFLSTAPNPNEWSVVSPGPCGCPSECLSGSCVNGACVCDAGWKGEDCSLLDCASGQTCSGRGPCVTIEDTPIDACECERGLLGNYSGADCSARMTPLPAIPNLLGYSQYTDWDEYDDNSPIFDDTVIAQIYLEIDDADLAFLILPSNENVRIYKKANMTFYGNKTNIKIMENVGMRVKGGASRNFAKKSWKISFNHFDEDRKWAQQKKMALKDVGMEPLYLRERASAAGMYAMGAPAQRSSHAEVYINNELWGMYLIMEDPGTNQFLQSRFGEKTGSLWKSGGGSLQYIAPGDPDSYRDVGYKAMNDEAEADFTPLANLIYIINKTPPEEFEEKIQTIFDVEYFLRTYAVEVATGNWDGIYNSNNFFLYYKTNGIFSYYRHDLDLSMGSLDFWYRFSTRNVWTWTTDKPRGSGYILPSRIMEVASFRAKFQEYLETVMQYINGDRTGSYYRRMNVMHGQINESAMRDWWHSLDQLMYSKQDFENNLQKPLVRPNVLPPNPYINGPSFSPFLAVQDFLKIREATTQQNLMDGPPTPP